MTPTSSPRRTPAPRATPGKKPKVARAGAAGASQPAPKKRVAFEVSNGEGNAEIVWATSTAAARREAMGELNAEFNELSTKRIPELDGGFKGDLNQWKFDNGWWSTCHYRPCHNERCGEDNGAVYRDGIWACCEEHHKLEVERRAEEKILKEAAKDEALRLKPGSTVHDVHFNPDGTAILDMTFPSGVRRWHTFLDWLASEEGQQQ